ncbi:MAG: M12 family metallo-peptidase [Phycisphaerales bacterium]|nr:M12 family metallo-peptidase [Phycisphaerales bacterium]
MPCRSIIVIALACCLNSQAIQAQLIMQESATPSLPQPAPSLIHDAELIAQVSSAFNLSTCCLVNLDVDDLPVAFNTAVPMEDEVLLLELAPHSVLSPNYQLLVQIEDGSIIEETPGPVRTFRGVVSGADGSVVAASVQEEGLTAKIVMPNGERIWVEPVRPKLAHVAEGMHVAYRDEYVMASGVTCGTESDSENIAQESTAMAAARGAACGTGLCFAELANDADFEYFNDYGSVANVEARVQSVVNAMNIEYENDVSITHVITAIMVRTSDAMDPYTATGSFALVNQVQSEWENNLDFIPRDITQLFTGKEIDGTTVGRAFDIGEVCTSGSYSFSQSDCCGPFSCTTDLHAHECGHVWNGIHCSPCGTMTTPLSCQNFFADFSIGRISSHRDSRSCLATSGALTVPFSDQFPTETLDPDNWRDINGAQSNTLGNGEPSPPNSLNVDGFDTIESNFMDTSNLPNGIISYWWQSGGNAEVPDPGDDLVVEYLNNINQWIQLSIHLGSGPDDQPFAFASFPIPLDGQHPFFRLRFRSTSNAGGSNDDWFIDNVTVDPGDITPPSPDPMTFAVIPPTVMSDTQILFEATTAVDDLFAVEYFFDKQFGPGCCGTDSPWQSSDSYLAEGLLANSSYSYKVKARDTASTPNETAISASFATNSTFIETPFNIALVDAQETEITVIITCNDTGDSNRCVLGSFTNLVANPPSGLFLDIVPFEGSGSNVWTDQQTITVTGLTPGTDYTFMAKARNRLSVETAFSGQFVFSTLPGIATGACCHGDGTCTVEAQANCNGPNDVYQGDDTTCSPNPCPQPGACCATDGTCTLATEVGGSDCTTGGGNYQGDDTTCTPNPCPQPGACCFDDGSCTFVFETDCDSSGGTYQGDNVTCIAAGCAQPGACCGTDGTCAPALEVGGNDCTTGGGNYQGDDTTCSPNPCPQPGACCADDGTCTPAAELGGNDCTVGGGAYQGDDTVCVPNPCPQPCALLGDINQDGNVDGDDVAGFIRAKLGLAPEPGEDQSCADYDTGMMETDMNLFVADLLS